MKAPAKFQATDAALRFQFGRIGRATALGLAAGQSAPTTGGGTMTSALPSAEVIRLPVRRRPRVVVGPTDGVVPASGIRDGNGPSASASRVLAGSKAAGGLAALDRLLEGGTLDAHQHAAALAYRAPGAATTDPAGR